MISSISDSCYYNVVQATILIIIDQSLLY